ncbi:MAG: acylphosphatase, partial [Candidatus Nitrosothermus koennekii]
MSKIRAHVLVSGKVQGVYFRQNMKQVARRHNVTGWVR